MTDSSENSPQTLAEWLQHATARFSGHSDSPRLDAEILLAAALEKPRSHLVAWPDNRLDGDALAQFHDFVSRRERGEPVAHILGRREFWSIPLRVTRDTLIPRPDTETLVEAALARIAMDKAVRILDLGTGSGAIALALKMERPLAVVHATDASKAALDVARTNAADLNLDVEFHEGHWWQALDDQSFDVVVSNPPYVATDDPHLERGDVRFEPRSALTSGAEGLDDIRAIVSGADRHLAPGGWILLEHGHDQAGPVRDILADHGFINIRLWRDFGGNDRVTEAQKPDPT